jgi:hypothetical protein
MAKKVKTKSSKGNQSKVTELKERERPIDPTQINDPLSKDPFPDQVNHPKEEKGDHT